MRAAGFSYALFLLLTSILLYPIDAYSRSLYAPPGLYEVERFRMANGFRVLLKQRTQARNVSFRLVVALGSRHFDCDRRETPHLIEHVLFSGTSRHTEAALDRLIEEHGGIWNAATGTRSTVYQIDIFDQYADLGLQTLHEIVTDTEFTAEKVRKAKDIVAREEGGKPSALRRFLYRRGVGKTAWKKANEWLLPGTGAVCRGLVNLDGITESDLASVFSESYVPRNMTLIAVGNFDRLRTLELIRNTFGRLAPAPVPSLSLSTPPLPAGGPVSVSASFAPFLGTSGYVGVGYRTGGKDSADAAALSVLTENLNTKLYEQVRVQTGLSYAPEATLFLQPDYGILYVAADSEIANLDRVSELVHDALEQTIIEPPPQDEIERTKRKILLQWAQGYETNAGMANYYADNLTDLGHYGRFRNFERAIERVTAADVTRIVAEYLRDESRADVRGAPTLTYTQFFGAIAAAVAAVIGIPAVMMRRAARRNKNIPWYRR